MSEQKDTFGMISVVCAVVSALFCVGSCIPGAGMLSMMAAPIGLVLGFVGMRQAKAANIDGSMSMIGLGINGIITALWIAYFVLIFLSVFGIVGLSMLGVLLEA